MKTLVIGASTDPTRYSYKAIHNLVASGHEVEALGIKKGSVADIIIKNGKPELKEIDTVTLYIGPKVQPEYYNYIVSLKPRRVIFNPGTENQEFIEILQSNNIEVEVACTLVLLATDSF